MVKYAYSLLYKTLDVGHAFYYPVLHFLWLHIVPPLNNLQENKRPDSCGKVPSLERMLSLIISHVGQKPCICPHIDPQCSFSSQMLTIPFLWRVFPSLKEVPP